MDSVVRYFEDNNVDLDKSIMSHDIFKYFSDKFKAKLFADWQMYEEILKLKGVDNEFKLAVGLKIKNSNKILGILDLKIPSDFIIKNFHPNPRQKSVLLMGNSVRLISLSPLVLTRKIMIVKVTGKSKIYHAIFVDVNYEAVLDKNDKICFMKDGVLNSKTYSIKSCVHEDQMLYKLYPKLGYSIGFGEKDDPYPEYGSKVWILKEIH